MDWRQLVKQYWHFLIMAGLGIALVFSLLRPFSGRNNQTDSATAAFSDQSEVVSVSSQAAPQSPESQSGFVDVKGAVKKPGIYQVEGNTRLFDVVRLAGGLAKDADQKKINLAQQVSDQQVIFIPKIGEEVPAEYAAPVAAGSTAAATDDGQATSLVNLNTATTEELQQLTGIGEKKAELIIQYREEQGGFKQIDDLKQVSGIGDKTFESLKDSITV